MTQEELSKLEKLARKAKAVIFYDLQKGPDGVHRHDPIDEVSPQTVLALIAKLRKAEKLVEALEYYNDHPLFMGHEYANERAREAIAEWRKE